MACTGCWRKVMRKDPLSQRGFSLIETIMALGVLTVGLMGAASVITMGMSRVSSSPSDLIATQKAAEAIESVFSARDSHVLVWAQIRNVNGSSGTDGVAGLASVEQSRGRTVYGGRDPVSGSERTVYGEGGGPVTGKGRSRELRRPTGEDGKG